MIGGSELPTLSIGKGYAVKAVTAASCALVAAAVLVPIAETPLVAGEVSARAGGDATNRSAVLAPLRNWSHPALKSSIATV